MKPINTTSHSFTSTITNLEKLNQNLLHKQYSNIFLLCGNKNAGKNTFAHYLMNS